MKHCLTNLICFGVPYTGNQKPINNMTLFDIESVYMENGDFKDTETAPRIWKHISILVSKSSDLLQKAMFFCDPNPRDLVSSFNDALEILALQKEAQMKS